MNGEAKFESLKRSVDEAIAVADVAVRQRLPIEAESAHRYLLILKSAIGIIEENTKAIATGRANMERLIAENQRLQAELHAPRNRKLQ